VAYQSRIPADPDYLQAVGQALYNFTYLEWVVVWTIVKLSADGFQSVPKGKPAGHIARALIKAINATAPPLPKDLSVSLRRFHKEYLCAIKMRNKLIHAHPYTTDKGLQQLSGGGHKWPTDAVDATAIMFEETAIAGNDIFHGDLATERP
jgi:hypothetical protein